MFIVLFLFNGVVEGICLAESWLKGSLHISTHYFLASKEKEIALK